MACVSAVIYGLCAVSTAGRSWKMGVAASGGTSIFCFGEACKRSGFKCIMRMV